MLVRLALESDVDAIVEMGRANVNETLPGEPFDAEIARETALAGMRTANITFFVVEVERKVIGFLQAEFYDFDYRSGFFTLQKVLYVSPENRGTRAAVRLMREFIAWSKRLGAAKAKAGNDNGFQSERTARFFQHFGFRPTGYALELDLNEV